MKIEITKKEITKTEQENLHMYLNENETELNVNSKNFTIQFSEKECIELYYILKEMLND